MSGYLNRELQIGDELVVEGPFGCFNYSPSAGDQPEHLTLVAGGSGITPMLSIVESVLTESDGPTIHLVYANRTPESTIFLERVEELAAQNSDRLRISLGFSQSEKQNNSVFRLRETLELFTRTSSS